MDQRVERHYVLHSAEITLVVLSVELIAGLLVSEPFQDSPKRFRLIFLRTCLERQESLIYVDMWG